MKEFWKPFKQQSAVKGNPLKAAVGDMRRDMRTAMGQITVKREDSRAVILKLRQILRTAQSAGGPTIDIRPFIVSHALPTISNEAEAQYSAIVLYGFICFEKFAIKQFEQEAANEDGRVIQELGIVTASLMVDKEFVWKGVPLVDLLLAKYHRACPILFGIRGDMRSAAGQARLGWVKISGVDPSVNTYNQRMTGLACGFAAMSLRAVAPPAIPLSEYWRAISSICNTPPQQLTGGHFMVLKGLIRDFARKFIAFYGAQANAVLRKATIVLPSRARPEIADAVNMVSVLPDVWKKVGITIQ
jgi:nucleoporin GLE1